MAELQSYALMHNERNCPMRAKFRLHNPCIFLGEYATIRLLEITILPGDPGLLF